MTMQPIWKKCPKCHRTYDWNPDIGVMDCPHCHGLGNKRTTIFDRIHGKAKDKDDLFEDFFDKEDEE